MTYYFKNSDVKSADIKVSALTYKNKNTFFTVFRFVIHGYYYTKIV